MRKTLSCIALMLMASVSAFAHISAVPQSMNVQGRVARPDDTPVAEGTSAVRAHAITKLHAERSGFRNEEHRNP